MAKTVADVFLNTKFSKSTLIFKVNIDVMDRTPVTALHLGGGKSPPVLGSAFVGGPFSELMPGTELGGFKILRMLGQGGMAKVYLVQHPRLPRQYALKVLNPYLSDDPRFRARFEREAHLAAQLDHPNVVAVHDRGIDRGLMWLAMQYVDGTDAAAMIQANPNGLSPAHVSAIITQAATGLDAAHRQGMLHRDVKPANLLITNDGRVLVADFGIARAVDDATNLTATGNLVATIAYAAPEIISGTQADHRSDIYSLGCTLYELLTGSKVFPRPSQVAMMDAHLQAAPPRPTDLRPNLPRAIDGVIAKALSKDPNRRYDTCRELADAAVAALNTSNTRVFAGRSAPRPRRKSKRWIGVAAVLALITASVGVGTWALWPDSERTLAGRWIGTVIGDTSGRLVADITDGDALSANVSYPDAGCTGTWANSRIESGIYRLSETVSSGPCADADVTLRRNSDGTLHFAAVYFSTAENRTIEITATLARDIDLGLDVPITVPACDGVGIVMLGAAVTPGEYAEDVARFLEKHPGASYLRTDTACPSLRQATDQGDPIYAVYREAGHSEADICAAVAAAGGDAYGTWLDRSPDPSQVVNCR